MSVYSVRKHHGTWSICAGHNPLMLLDSYEEALAIACSAAGVLADANHLVRRRRPARGAERPRASRFMPEPGRTTAKKER
jgi:hypothetical protein